LGNRRKKPDGPDGEAATVVAEPPVPEQQNGQPVAEQPAAPKIRPAASFAANSDRTTRIEVAVWARQVKVGEAEEYTQYSLTARRSWRDRDGNWTVNDFYRAHDVPVLQYLIGQAYNWCVAQRTEVRIESDEPLPF
jgi:hypothetical protein